MKTFFSDLKNSFYNPTYYTSVLERGLFKGIVFVFLLSLLSALIIGGKVAITAVPAFFHFSPRAYVETYYPNELTVTIKDGQVHTNVAEPYTIPFAGGESADPKNILVIDTTHDIGINDIDSYESFAVLAKEVVIFKKTTQETRIIPLKNIKDLTITKDAVRGWAAEANTILNIAIVPLLVVALLGISIGAMAWYLFSMIFGALVVIIVAKARGMQLSYGQAYRTSLVALGPVVVCTTVMDAVGMYIPFVGVLLLFVVLLWVNIKPFVQSDTSSGVA